MRIFESNCDLCGFVVNLRVITWWRDTLGCNMKCFEGIRGCMVERGAANFCRKTVREEIWENEINAIN